MKLNIKYENDRGTPSPERIFLKEETGNASHPKLWWFEIEDILPILEDWIKKWTGLISAPEVAVATYELEKLLSIKDPTSLKDWQAKGIMEINYTKPSGFANWPDPDLGKCWDGSKISLVR